MSSFEKQKTTELTRLITFEIDDREHLLILAGTGEMDQRVIHRSGDVEGRFTVVAADQLVSSGPVMGSGIAAADITPNPEDMRVIGSAAALPQDFEGSAGLVINGQQWTQMSAPGHHFHLWMPPENE